MESQGWTQGHMEKEVTDGIQNVLKQVFELSETKCITTEAAARQVAEKRLSFVT